jgi:tetratricopeptide (TPR) repeat protein
MTSRDTHIQNLEQLLARPSNAPLTRPESKNEDELVVQRVTNHFSPQTNHYWNALIGLNNTTKAHQMHCEVINVWNSFTQQQQDEILTELKQAVGIVPDAHSDLWFLLCFSILRAYQKDKNVELISRVIQRLQERPLRPYGIITDRNMLIVLLNNRMLAYKAIGDANNAINDFNKIVDLDNRYAIAYSNISGVYLMMKDVHNAIDSCNKAIHIDPQFHVPYYMRGLVHRLTDNYHNALSDLNTAIQLNQGYKLAHNERSKVHLTLNNIDYAIQDASIVIQLDPEHAESHYVRGYGLCRNKDWDTAWRDLTRALYLTQSPPLLKSIHAARGEVLFHKRDFQNAIQEYNEALKLDPNDAEVYMSRSSAYEMLNDLKNASRDAEKAYSLRPSDPKIKEHYMKLTSPQPQQHHHQSTARIATTGITSHKPVQQQQRQVQAVQQTHQSRTTSHQPQKSQTTQPKSSSSTQRTTATSAQQQKSAPVQRSVASSSSVQQRSTVTNARPASAHQKTTTTVKKRSS